MIKRLLVSAALLLLPLQAHASTDLGNVEGWGIIGDHNDVKSYCFMVAVFNSDISVVIALSFANNGNKLIEIMLGKEDWNVPDCDINGVNAFIDGRLIDNKLWVTGVRNSHSFRIT